jgi:cyclophilin family peptidyl-prolyl cis-trans isomerase
MPKDTRHKGRVIKSASPSHKKLYIVVASIVIIIVGGFAGWYSYSAAHTITTTTQNTTASGTVPPDNTTAFVKITTNYGSITLELFQNDTPKTVANFLQLISSGFYAGLYWYRIVRDTNPTEELIQTGDPSANANGNTDPCQWGQQPSSTNVPLEIVSSLQNDVGYVGMWHPAGDSGGGGTQFFINLSNNTQFDGNYTVFGKVISGLDVAQTIDNLPINPSCGSSTDGPPQTPSDGAILQTIIEQ